MKTLIDSALLFIVVVISVYGINETHSGNEIKTICEQVPSYPREQNKGFLYQSSDNGNTWQSLGSILPENLQIASVFAQNGELYLGSANGILYHSSNPQSGNWEREVIDESSPAEAITGIFNGHSGMYASVSRHGFFRKKHGETTWQPVHQTLADKKVNAVLENPDGTIFVGCFGGIFRSDDDCKTWKQVLKEYWVTGLISSGGVLVCNGSQGLQRSADNGEHWELVLHEEDVAYRVKFIDGRFTANRVSNNWLSPVDYCPQSTLTSYDKGKTWVRFNGSFLSNRRIYDLEDAGKYLFCSHKTGISRSADGGKNWELMGSTVFFGESKQFELVVSGQIIFAVEINWGC